MVRDSVARYVREGDNERENYREEYEKVDGLKEFRKVHVGAMWNYKGEYVTVSYELGHKVKHKIWTDENKHSTPNTIFHFVPIPIEKVSEYKRYYPDLPEDLLKEALEEHISKRIKRVEENANKEEESLDKSKKYLEKLNEILLDIHGEDYEKVDGSKESIRFGDRDTGY